MRSFVKSDLLSRSQPLIGRNETFFTNPDQARSLSLAIWTQRCTIHGERSILQQKGTNAHDLPIQRQNAANCRLRLYRRLCDDHRRCRDRRRDEHLVQYRHSRRCGANGDWQPGQYSR
ncbi:putative acetyltransferase/acyltransferase [Geobacillus sp. WSUCF1]|nr:putative acetyltransferase/acyltransferase [Geobacillus sp. WSUCF1]